MRIRFDANACQTPDRVYRLTDEGEIFVHPGALRVLVLMEAVGIPMLTPGNVDLLHARAIVYAKTGGKYAGPVTDEDIRGCIGIRIPGLTLLTDTDFVRKITDRLVPPGGQTAARPAGGLGPGGPSRPREETL